MTVKSIFKVLIGTTAGLIIFALVIEMISADVNGNQFATDLRKSVLNACELYSQESFRRTDASTGHTMANRDGIFYTSKVTGGNVELLDSAGKSFGEFYDGTDSTDIYNKIYGVSKNGSILSAIGLGAFSKFSSARDEGVDITPMNLGYVYMDRDTLERMARWALCKNLSRSGSIVDVSGSSYYRNDMIGEWLYDDSSDYTVYIKRGGFLVDINSFKIDNIAYENIDLSTASGLDRFKELTGTTTTSREVVNVANIKCHVDVQYNGIWILKHIVEGDLKGVKGLSNTDGLGYTGTHYQGAGTNSKSIGSGDERLRSSGKKASTLQGNIVYYNIT